MGVKFKAIKKTSEPYYAVPEVYADKLGIKNISESGICFVGKGMYSKAFVVSETLKAKASVTEKIKGSMMVLRGYDVPFKYIEYDTGEVILDINVTAKDFEEAKNILDHLELDMRSSLHTFGLLIAAMDLQKRLRFLHQRIMKEYKSARLDVNDYLKNTSWPADFDYKKFKDGKETIKTETQEKGYFFARKMPTENVGTLYETIRKNLNVTDMMIDYEPISDIDLFHKMRELYDDVPGEAPEVDERNYIMAGIYFAIAGDTEAHIEKEFLKLKEAVYPYGCEISPYYYSQQNAMKAFITFSTEKIKQLRNIKVANAVKTSPFQKKELEPSSIMDAFDSFLSNQKNDD